MRLRPSITWLSGRQIGVVAGVLLAVAMLACGSGEPVIAPTTALVAAESAATEAPTFAATPAPTTVAPTSTPAPTATVAPSPTPTPTATLIPTQTPIPSTATPEPTATPPPTPIPTARPTPTATPLPSPLPTPTPRPTVGPGHEQRNIFLPLAGEVQLTIQRDVPGAARSMDLLEHTVRTIEEFIGEEFPVRFIGILFKDAVNAAEGSAGTNFGNVIAQRTKYDVDDDSPEANFLPGLTAHEVAHYYWRSDEDWIDEGAATFMEFIVENARTGAPLVADRYPCPYFENLGELDRANPTKLDAGNTCNYSLGERLFLDLYRTLGREQFREGFRNLYLASKRDSVHAGIEEVEAAFKKDASPEVVAAVDSVLNRQYYGTEPYDLSFLDTSPVDPNLRSVDGYVREAFIVLDLDRPEETRTDQFSAADFQGRIYLVLRTVFPITQNPKELMLEYVAYYEDGFAYGRRAHRHVFQPDWTNARSITSIGSSHSWRPGSYWVYVYEDDRKVAEVAYEVTP